MAADCWISPLEPEACIRTFIRGIWSASAWKRLLSRPAPFSAISTFEPATTDLHGPFDRGAAVSCFWLALLIVRSAQELAKMSHRVRHPRETARPKQV